VDCGYDWVNGIYMPDKVFSVDYYTTHAAFQLASYPLVCAFMGVQSRSRFAGAVARAVKRCIDDDPKKKPDLRTVRGMVANDPELKGFIPAFIITALMSWVIGQLLDWIWLNWSETPSGEPD